MKDVIIMVSLISFLLSGLSAQGLDSRLALLSFVIGSFLALVALVLEVIQRLAHILHERKKRWLL